jgi:hypothetical protein
VASKYLADVALSDFCAAPSVKTDYAAKITRSGGAPWGRRSSWERSMAKEQLDTVYKIVDVVGVSEKSWEDASRNAG